MKKLNSYISGEKISSLDNYINEKLKISTNTKDKSILLDNVYNNVDELVNDLNIYFKEKGKLANEIKIKSVSPLLRRLKAVKDTFTIEFNNTPSKIHFGIEFWNGDEGLIFQIDTKNWSGKMTPGTIHRELPYKFGEDNFKDWICNDIFKKSNIKNYFYFDE